MCRAGPSSPAAIRVSGTGTHMPDFPHDTKWWAPRMMAEYGFGNDLASASALVLAHHYSKRLPSNVQHVFTWHEAGGFFGDSGPVVAACFFSIPPTRWSVEVLELTRLVRLPCCKKPLSTFLSMACRELRRLRAVPLLVSFADQQHGHHGGIYRASGWRLHALRPPACEGLVINGTFVPGRTCNARYGTRSLVALRQRHPEWVIESKWDSGKWCYWKALNRHGTTRAKVAGLRGLGFNGEPWLNHSQGSGSIPEGRLAFPEPEEPAA
jgi:hypothetical protein